MNKLIKNYIKNFKINKQNLVSSVRSTGLSLVKIFLLHKLQKIRHFKHISLILLIITKWSLFSIILTFIYGKISSIFGFKYDLDFIISFSSAIGALYSEVSWDMVHDYWLKIVDLYNRFIAKIVVKLSEKPETVEYSNRAKDLISKWNDKMPTDPRVKIHNQKELIEYYINIQIEEEKLKDPNYRPNKGWFTWNSMFAWYPLTFKETVSYVSYAIGFAGLITVAYYSFESIRTIFEGFQSVVHTLNEINNMRRNFPRYIFNWVTRQLWGDNQDANNQEPEQVQNNNSWYNWLTSFYPFNRNNQTTTATTTTNNTAGRSWLFLLGNPWRASHNNEDDSESQNNSNQSSSNSSVSPIESGETERRNKDSIRNLGLDQLKALICSYLNLTPEIPDTELYDSIKDKVNELSNTSTTENIAMTEWISLHETFVGKGNTGSSSWGRVLRSLFNSPAVSRQNTEEYDYYFRSPKGSDSEDDNIGKGKSPMHIPGGFNGNWGSSSLSSSSINPEDIPLPDSDSSSGNTTPTPPTPKVNTQDLPVDNNNNNSESTAEENIDINITNVWESQNLIPLLLISNRNFNKYFPRIINLIKFVFSNYKNIFLFSNYKLIFLFVKYYFLDKNKYIIKNTLLDIVNFVNKFKHLFKKDQSNNSPYFNSNSNSNFTNSEDKLAITYFVKNYEYGLGGNISYKFAYTIFLHYHWNIFPNQKIKDIAMEGYFILSVYIKKNPYDKPIIVIENNLNSLHKFDDNYIKNYQGHFNFNTILDNVLRNNDLNKPKSSFIIVFEYEYITYEEYQEYIIDRS